MATKAKRRRERVENLVRRMNEDDTSEGRTWRVIQRGSAIGSTESQRATLRSLGLRHRESTALVKDSLPTRGRIRTVAHLVAVEEV